MGDGNLFLGNLKIITTNMQKSWINKQINKKRKSEIKIISKTRENKNVLTLRVVSLKIKSQSCKQQMNKQNRKTMSFATPYTYTACVCVYAYSVYLRSLAARANKANAKLFENKIEFGTIKSNKGKNLE